VATPAEIYQAAVDYAAAYERVKGVLDVIRKLEADSQDIAAKQTKAQAQLATVRAAAEQALTVLKSVTL
jgi:hypothetical protein